MRLGDMQAYRYTISLICIVVVAEDRIFYGYLIANSGKVNHTVERKADPGSTNVTFKEASIHSYFLHRDRFAFL